MNIEEEQHWLVLQQIFGGRSSQLRRLFALSHSASEILESDAASWRAAGVDSELLSARRHWRRQFLDSARRQQETLRALEAVLVPLHHPGYPTLLAEIPDPPPLLYVRGDLALLQQAWFAVVGSRKASAMGRRAASEFVQVLVAAGLGVSSGMALGIDAAAHSAALDCGGRTCAVVATGLDRCYPRAHRALGENIARQGLILSEYPLGSEPLRERFPQRNRIISGLSLGVLVVEAARRSGSLITARMALEQNREVFALPQSIYHPQGRGCNSLLRQGAQLVESPLEILAELGPMYSAQCELRQQEPATALNPLQQQFFDAVGFEPMGVEELAACCKSNAGEAMVVLMELQLLGHVSSRDGQYMRC
jgi:DNA processing protein